MSALALAFVLFMDHYNGANFRINVQVAFANLVWACGCYLYFSPRRIAEGQDVWVGSGDFRKPCFLVANHVLSGKHNRDGGSSRRVVPCIFHTSSSVFPDCLAMTCIGRHIVYLSEDFDTCHGTIKRTCVTYFPLCSTGFC